MYNSQDCGILFRKIKNWLFSAVLLLAACGGGGNSAGTNGGNGADSGVKVTWTPQVYEVNIFPGTTETGLLQFSADGEITDSSLFVVPEISHLLTVEATGLDKIAPEQTYSIPATIEVAMSVSPGSYEGTVQGPVPIYVENGFSQYPWL